jgi:hypothetical protein
MSSYNNVAYDVRILVKAVTNYARKPTTGNAAIVPLTIRGLKSGLRLLLMFPKYMTSTYHPHPRCRAPLSLTELPPLEYPHRFELRCVSANGWIAGTRTGSMFLSFAPVNMSGRKRSMTASKTLISDRSNWNDCTSGICEMRMNGAD